MTYTQYIDARGKRHKQGIAELCQILEQHIQNATPKHYFVSPLKRRVGRSLVTRVSLPPGFVSVELTEGKEGWEQGGSAAFIRVSDYSCLQAFLDELYINYLKDRFKPLTYGSSWILEEDKYAFGLILVPWSWLISPHSSSRPESQWLQNTPLNDCWLLPGTSWRLRMTMEVKAIGLAINDERIFSAMRRRPKAVYFLRKSGVLMPHQIDKVSADYRFRFVINYRSIFFLGDDDIDAGTALVQSQEPVQEDNY